jgi:hypothetical protein
MFKATGDGPIAQATVSLVQLRAGQLAGNTGHTAAQTGNPRKAGETNITVLLSGLVQDQASQLQRRDYRTGTSPGGRKRRTAQRGPEP